VTSLPLVRVRLKHTDADTFVQRFAPNVTRGGIFLASRDPRPVGVLVRFEVTLLNGTVMLAGQGRVAWVKPYDPAEPSRAHGMGVQFTEVEPGTRAMLDRLLAKKEGGRPPPRPPAPPPGTVAAVLSASGSAERRVTEGNLTEFDNVEESALRRALDRARALAPSPDNLDELLAPGAESISPSLDEALSELPRYLARGRGSGLFRLPPEPPRPQPAPPSPPTPAAPTEPISRTEAETPVVEVVPPPEAGGTPEAVADQETRRFDNGEGSDSLSPRERGEG
jgi:uncharacterized protein (TIGR02266 family)